MASRHIELNQVLQHCQTIHNDLDNVLHALQVLNQHACDLYDSMPMEQTELLARQLHEHFSASHDLLDRTHVEIARIQQDVEMLFFPLSVDPVDYR